MELVGHYNVALVLLSVIIAIISAYTALSLISRFSDIHTSSLERLHVLSSGLVMGLGIWSMHFVAMLAFDMGMPVRYGGQLTLLSMIAGVAACTAGLAIIAGTFSITRIVVAGTLIGTGIVAMHYIGMAAMHMTAVISYSPVLVVASVLVGVSASIAAIWTASAIVKGELENSYKVKVPGSIIMGIAISGMHYTAMMGTRFIIATNAVHAMPDGLNLDPDSIGALLTLSILSVMAFALWSSRMAIERDIIRISEERLSAITENVTDAMITMDSRGIIQSVNPSTNKIFGYESDELIGENVKMLMPSPWRDRHDTYIHNYLLTGDKKIIGTGYRDAEGIKKDGTVFPIDIAVSEAHAAGEQMFIGVIRDITERVHTQNQLHYLAHHDSLTMLPNRSSFMKHIEQAVAHASRRSLTVAVLFLDLDRFKIINDTLGHDVGDYLLQKIADRLTGCVREGDIVSRISGDEFSILLDDVSDISDVEPIANKIIDSLREPFIYEDQELFASASIGISIFPGDGATPKALMKYADVAMYAAKEKGGNCFHFYENNDDGRENKRLSVESYLRRALEKGEFFLQYQPQIDASSGRVTCVEALIRWQHEKLGLVYPDEFIHILEETGDIVQVGEWVIREACEKNKQWQRDGLSPVRVAVNLSARQFGEADLANRIHSIIKETGMDPEYLELEITESILMRQTHVVRNTIRALHAFGIKMAIDDFGTGYSSLSYLKRFPIDVLKIDRSFVRDIHMDSNDAAIVKLIIDMAHSLNIDVVAEGVETEDQLDFLKKQNCKSFQGYLYSKPLSDHEISAYLLSHDDSMINSGKT